MGQNVEEWVPIAGYEGLYEISDQGRVRSLNYRHTGRTQVLKSGMDKLGYLHIDLCKDGKLKHYYVHRLVAEAFLDNPLGLAEVNHIDEDKTNNAVSNLEWCDRSYNINHGTRNARASTAMTNGKLSKPVQQLTKDGRLITTWPSMIEAARQTGINCGGICSCCKGSPQHRTAGGYIWRYL